MKLLPNSDYRPKTDFAKRSQFFSLHPQKYLQINHLDACMAWVRYAKFLLSFPKRGRLDPERAQVHVALPAMVDLVLDAIKNRVDPGVLPLVKRLVHFLKSMRGNGGPDLVDRQGRFVPQP